MAARHIDDPWTKSVKDRMSSFERLTTPEKRKLMLEIELNQLRKEIRLAQAHNLGRKEVNALVAKYIRTRNDFFAIHHTASASKPTTKDYKRNYAPRRK